MDIRVIGDNWGGAESSSLKIIADEVLSHLAKHLSPALKGVIVVVKGDAGTPRTSYRVDLNGHFYFSIEVSGADWREVASQFAHELCRLLSDRDSLTIHRCNQWFHQTLCELASLYCLQQMIEARKHTPASFRHAHCDRELSEYFNAIRSEHLKKSRSDPALRMAADDLRAIVAKHLKSLRANPSIHELNTIVAFQLLPFVTANPFAWNIIRHLPDTDASFESFLKQWHDRTPVEYRKAIAEIAGLFGIDISRQF